jgi:hypothetical protein
MPLDPDKLRMVTEKAETLSKRFDAFLERGAINDAADDEEEEEGEEEELLDPALEALTSSTLGAPPNKVPDPPEVDKPWFE